MIDWDDLRYALAVARTGSALRAARALNVNQTTVTRRIAQLEAALGTQLFESRRSGQLLTPAGQLVAAGAERIEAEVSALQSTIGAEQRMLSGSLRFTSSDVYADRIMAPFLRGFRQRYPGITVEVIAADRQLDIARGEADVALRATPRPEGSGIVAQRLPNTSWGPYCARAYAEEHGLPATVDELNNHAIVVFENNISKTQPFRWLPKVAGKATVSARSNSLINSLFAVKAGLGIGMLPCFVGDTEPDLVRCLPPIRELDADVWLIVREDIKQTPHVRAFVDCLAAHMAALRPQFSGETPRRPGASPD